MKLSYSKKGDERGRHLVLSCDSAEAEPARRVIVEELLDEDTDPYIEYGDKVGQTKFLFATRYLDDLMLAFPFADLSKGIHRKMLKAEEIRLEGFEVPDLVIPGYKGDLYNFQKIAVAMLTDPDYAKAHGHTGVIDFLNDEMGLGKTYTALAAIAVLDAYPALIVVPNNTKYTWLEVCEDYYPKLKVGVYDTQEQDLSDRDSLIRERNDLTVVNIEAIRARKIRAHGNKYGAVTGYEYDNPALFDFTYEYAVLDEHHLVKNPDAQITNGFFQLDAEDWWCPMSGTPVLNRPEEIWTVLHKIYPEQFPSYRQFESELCIKVNNIVVGYKPEAMSKLRAFLQDRTLRRRKDQVLKDMPKVVTKPVMVTLSAEERRLYNRIEDEMVLEMEAGNITHIGGALPQITRLKQACFSPELYGGSKKSSKVEELKKIVAELVKSGEKALIFTQWEKAALILKRELAEYDPAYVTGKVKNRARMEQIRKFQKDDDCHLFIGTIRANREGINLGAATYVIFTDEGWTPAGQDQAIGRSAAGGLRGMHAKKGTVVTVVILAAEDSYEQHIEKMLKRKRQMSNVVTERDGGKVIKIERTSVGDLRKMLSKRNQQKKAA